MPDQQIETIDHPTLGPLKFPVDMGPDERNESIDRAMMNKAQNPHTSIPAPDIGKMDQAEGSIARTAGIPGGSTNVRPASDAGLYGAGAGIGAAGLAVGGPPAYGAVAGMAAKHPILAQMIASEGISHARKIPYVGKMIPPYSEMLPYLIGGKGEKPDPGVLHGPEAPPPEITQSRGLAVGGHAPPEPAAALESIPVRKPPIPVQGDMDMPFGGALDKAQPVIAKPQITPGSSADNLETKGIQEQMREAGEREDRQRLSQSKSDWFARNTPGKSKGELTGTAKPRSNPLAGKRMDFSDSKPVSGKAVRGSQDEDLTPLLQKSLEVAKKKKGS